MTKGSQFISTGKSKHTKNKPFLTGSIFDERTAKSALTFFGTLIIVFFISFIACVSASFSSLLLRLLLNSAVIILALYILYNNGAKRGAEDVTKGEILWQKKEKGQYFSDSEKEMSFHVLKGFVNGMLGSIPFIILGIVLAFNTTIQMTESGALPSWMQAYTNRNDIGKALVNYLQPEGMNIIDFIRMIVRITILPFVNIVGTGNKTGVLWIERLSPIILMLPALSYGAGYMSGRSIRAQVHTAINENERKRIRREKKKTRNIIQTRKEPDKLN